MSLEERNVYLEDIPLTEARQRLELALREAGRWQPLPGETVALRAALGRVTAAPVWARLSAPHYHASAMDGYAVRASDTMQATETRPVTLSAEQARPVNTGEPLPSEANAVIMIEHVQLLPGDAIQIIAPVAPWQHVRMMGEDMVATELVLPENHRLRPVDLGAAAGCGHAQLMVRRKPRVVLIPTGSELLSADDAQQPAPGQIIEYNSVVLGAQIEAAGGLIEVLPITPDDPAALETMLRRALDSAPELVLLLSGSSAGSHDYTAALIRRMGELLVHGIAVRPGHPVILGMVAQTPVIGIPGYPVSAALTGELFVQPLMAQWLGVPAEIDTRPRLQATMTRKLTSPTGDDDFIRVTLAQVGERLLAAPLNRGAGVITSLVRADGLALIPRFVDGVEMGQSIEVLLYRSPDEIARTLLAMGSHDPMLDLLAQHLAVAYPGSRLTSANVGSLGGIVALRRREAHLAGMHLLDEETGEYNLPYLQRQMAGARVRVITFAQREQGFLVAPGNPAGVRSFDDLPRLRYVNRQRGAGTRLLLDYELKRHGITPETVAGYEREEYTHLAVAVAVASGIADTGLGVRSAALALGLDFVPVGWERYDIVIPQESDEHPALEQLLTVLRGETFRAALAAQPGYDARDTGQLVFEGAL